MNDDNKVSIQGHKGIIDWVLGTTRSDWDTGFRDQGVRLLALAQTFPDVPAGWLIALTEGNATVTENEDGTLTLEDTP